MDAVVSASAAAMATPAAASPDLHDAKPSIEADARPPTALTPPTSEEMNVEDAKKDSDSELSDLDLDLDLDDEDDDEEIEPDHYWDGGRVPVFKPTMDQFRSFKKFMSKIDRYGMRSGIVKVIPPQEWRDALPSLDEHVKRIKIKNPITQEFNGTFGTYTQQNVEKQRSYNLPEWKALTEETQHQPPAKRGERRKNQDKLGRGATGARARASASAAAQSSPEPGMNQSKSSKKGGRSRLNPVVSDDVDSSNEASRSRRGSRAAVVNAPDSPASKPADKKAAKARGRPSRGTHGSANGNGGQAKSVTSRRLNNTSEAADNIDEEAFDGFNYRMEDLDEFTPERCAELETQYWKSLAFNQPMYAADMPGSLFDDTCNTWNVANLPNLLDVLGTKVPGVNTAYLYMGMWKATFAWHLEDVDLYSINYIHFGAPKQWYSISQEDARKFESAMKSNWPVDAKNCDQFLRHKTYLISPDVLQKQHRVKVNKLVHYEGEFVITFPYGYHSGYNIGYNCAESVNFATESWLEYGRIAKKCNCEADNVWVDVYEIERKLRGEPTPEYIEETDDDEEEGSDGEDGSLPTPPASVKGKARGRKRKRDAKDDKTRTKKKKKIRVRIRLPGRQPCTMCPNENPWDVLLPTDTGKRVHRCCALYTPETWIEKDADGVETAFGSGSIDRARLDLKCNFCRSKRGACFQCSSKKCTRAFHATCAVAAGVLVDAGPVPTYGEDGTEYFEEGFDFRCKYHRPKAARNLTVEMLEGAKRLINYGKDLKPNDTIQAQYRGADIFGALVIENRPAELSVLVDVLPEGERIEVEYKFLCLLDPDDSLRPKPTMNAVPMPAGMNKKHVSANNRQDGVPTQGQVFHDDEQYKFQDFHNIDMPPPGYMPKRLQTVGPLKADLAANDQLYFYLPRLSTDTKCFFTDTVNGRNAASKANFLERVSPPKQSMARLQQTNAAKSATVRTTAPKATFNTFVHHERPPIRPQPSLTSSSASHERPYMYKPKQITPPSNSWSIDPQALAATPHGDALDVQPQSLTNIHVPTKQITASVTYSAGDTSRLAVSARSFPREQYYSIQTLPAAFQGDYSGFRQAAGLRPRAASHGVFVPDYQAITLQQPKPQRASVSGAPSLVSGQGLDSSSNSRPSSSTYSQPSPLAAPLTPATTTASISSKEVETPAGYLENLKKYPYLLNSYLRRDKQYTSPYTTSGGFTQAYQPMSLGARSQDKKHARTPSCTALSDSSKLWTPPSAVFDRAGLAKHRSYSDSQTPPPPIYYAHPPRSSYPSTTYQSPYQLQQTLPPTVMTFGGRDGMLSQSGRDTAYGHWSMGMPAMSSTQQCSPLGQPFTTSPMWQSPKAPMPSPMSDINTPGMSNHGLMRMHGPAPHPWALISRLGGENMQRQSSAGYGPMLPQMGALHDP